MLAVRPVIGSDSGRYRWYQTRTRLPKRVPYPSRLPAGPEGGVPYPDPLYPRVQTRLPGPITKEKKRYINKYSNKNT